MSDKLNIEQLVSSKLGEAEIEPAQGSWPAIQRKLRWRQFMRFDPVKLNIFYLGGLLVISAGLILLLNTDQSDTGSMKDTGFVRDANPAESIRNKNITPNQEELVPEDATNQQHEVASGKIRAASQDREADRDVSQSNREPANDVKGSALEEFETIPGDTSSTGHARELPVQNTLVPYFTCSVQYGCAPLIVQFFNQSLNETSFHWSFGTEGTMQDQDPVYKFIEPGKHVVTLAAKNAEGQTATYHQIIEVYPSPTAEFEIEEGIKSPDGLGNFDLINYSEGASSYAWNLVGKSKGSHSTWSSNEFQPSIQLSDIEQGTRYLSLVATNEDGCTDSTIQVIPDYPGSFTPTLRFPTAFSPNPSGPGGGQYSPHEKRIDLFYPVF